MLAAPEGLGVRLSLTGELRGQGCDNNVTLYAGAWLGNSGLMGLTNICVTTNLEHSRDLKAGSTKPRVRPQSRAFVKMTLGSSPKREIVPFAVKRDSL